MGWVTLPVSYNRARNVLYGDTVRALTAMSISFAVVKEAPVLWFPFLSEPKESVYGGWKKFNTPCAGMTLELSFGLFLPQFPYLQNARNYGAQ